MIQKKVGVLCGVHSKRITMKTANLLSIMLLTFSTATMAQKGFDVEKEITINVSAEEIWNLVGPGFVDVYKWSSNVDHASGKGQSEFEGAACSERFCDVNVSGFSSISEKLTNYSADNMTLTYQVQDGMPGFIELAENTWTIVPVDATHAKLIMAAKFRVSGLMGGMMKGSMKRKMEKTLSLVLNDAKVYMETGEVSALKAERMEKLARKQAA